MRSVLSDLDRRIADNQMQEQHENEKCEYYKEEMELFEKQYGDNVKNIQR